MILSKQAFEGLARLISNGERPELELLDPVETGGWCDPCALPSLATFPLRGITASGVHDLGTVTACVEHGMDP